MLRHFGGTKSLYFSKIETHCDILTHIFDHFVHRFSDDQSALSKAISTDGAESFANYSSACTASAKIAATSRHAAVLLSQEIEGLPNLNQIAASSRES